MSHVTGIWMSHVTDRWKFESYKGVMSHTRMSDHTHENKSCHEIECSFITFESREWVMSQSYEWVTSQSYEWVMSHALVMWMGHTTQISHMNESCHSDGGPGDAWYGVATVSKIDKITGLFCRISSLLYGSFAKVTYDFIDPTNQSHPIVSSYLRYIKWVMSHTLMSHVTHKNESCHACKCIMSQSPQGPGDAC